MKQMNKEAILEERLSTPSGRLRHAIFRSGFKSISDFCRQSEVNDNTMRAHLRGHVPDDALDRYATVLGVASDWLKHGKGNLSEDDWQAALAVQMGPPGREYTRDGFVRPNGAVRNGVVIYEIIDAEVPATLTDMEVFIAADDALRPYIFKGEAVYVSKERFTGDAIGEKMDCPVVARLETGETAIGVLMYGAAPGLWSLFQFFGRSPIHNIAVTYVAPILFRGSLDRHATQI